MPEIYQRKVKGETVRGALSDMRRELLPEEIRSDVNARWILGFDELQAQRSREFPDQRRRKDNEFTIWIVEAMLSTALQRQIPFYFASLFHIGRQWSVSEKSLLAVRKAGTRQNLLASARQTAQSLQERGRLTRELQLITQSAPEALAQELGPMLEAARAQHEIRMSEARNWWKAWRSEVDALRVQVRRVQESDREILDERIWPEVAQMTFGSQRPSALRLSMQASGLQFTSEATSSEHSLLGFNDTLAPVMLAFLASAGDKHWGLRYFDDYFRHYFHDALREAHYRPMRELAMRRLNAKYRDSDPFEVYRPLKKPASEQLRDLIAEHTLPDSSNSPWLQVWEDCLAPTPEYSFTLAQGDVTDYDTLTAFAASADSTIKKKIHDDDIQLGESWMRFIQRLFESWLHDVAEEAADTHKKAKDSKGPFWDFKQFSMLADGVAARLAKMGYQLKTPSAERLKRLWEKLHTKDPGDTSDW